MFGLTTQDIIAVAILALIITYLVLKLQEYVQRIHQRNREFFLEDLRISEKAFDQTEFEFQGKILKRGMEIVIIEESGEELKGKLIGRHETAICIASENRICAIASDIVENIREC